MTPPTDAPGPPRSWPALLGRLLGGTDLTAEDTAWVMDQVLAGDASDVRLAGFLVALRAKGETAEEIAGLAEAMLAHARRVPLAGPAVDVVGTRPAAPVRLEEIRLAAGAEPGRLDPGLRNTARQRLPPVRLDQVDTRRSPSRMEHAQTLVIVYPLEYSSVMPQGRQSQ